MIVGKRLQLRAIEMEDLSLLIEWRNDPEIYKNLYEQEPLSLVMERSWFESFLQRNDEKFWIIENILDREPIGTVGLVHIDWRNRKSEWSRFLIYPPKYKRGGYDSETESLILRYVFEHMNLNRLYVEVFSRNLNVINLHKKFGFKKEGLFKKHIFKDGQYIDIVIMALLKDDYLALSKEIIKKYLED